MTEQNPIIRRSLHDELLNRIRTMIVNGELRAGAKVPERQLCVLFGVSRTPLREALKVLDAEGLVAITPNRGAIVTDVSIEVLEEGFPVMAALEALSGELACRSITDEEIAAIREMHESMREAFNHGSLSDYIQFNRQIHDAILAATRNELLETHYQLVCLRVRRARLAANFSREQQSKAMAEHEDIIKHLEMRDAAKLSSLLRQHILNLLVHFRENLQSKTAEGM